METRKLIAHGPSSLTVALPYKWINKQNLKKGDEITINEDNLGLKITAKPSETKKTIQINLTSLEWPSILTALTSIYRQGYDEVIVKYKVPKEYQNISNAVRSLVGFAVMENHNGKCLIKSLPSELEQDFETMFRRVFLILLQELDDLKDILSSQDAIKNFYTRDADLNAIVNLAIRLISKGYVQDRFEELHLFHALLMLEEIGDDITKFTIEIQNYKDAPKLKEEIELCTKMLRMLYDSYFQKKGNINDFYKQYYLYWPGEKKQQTPIYQAFAISCKTKPIFYLRSAVEKIIHLAEILMLPNIE